MIPLRPAHPTNMIPRVHWHLLIALCTQLVIVASCKREREAPRQADTAAVARKSSADRGVAFGDTTTFGRISDAEAWTNGRLIVLDNSLKRITVFGPDGRVRFEYARLGQGPGELFRPLRIALMGDSLLLVLDQAGRMSQFALVGDSLALRRDIRIIANASDVCVLGARVFLLALHDGRLIHEITPAGDIMRSFGEPRASNVLERELQGTGLLLCARQQGPIVIAAANLPFIAAYSPSGTPMWAAEIENFHRTQYVTSNGGFSARPDESGVVHHIVGLSEITDSTFYAQLEVRATAADDPRNGAIESRQIVLMTGLQQGARNDLPRLLAPVDDGAFVSRVGDYPSVEKLALTQLDGLP